MSPPRHIPPPPLTTPATALIELRGRSGRLYGYYDPQAHTYVYVSPKRVETVPLPRPIGDEQGKS